MSQQQHPLVIAYRVSGRRRAIGMRREELAVRAQIPLPIVARIENPNALAEVEDTKLRRIADALEVSFSFLTRPLLFEPKRQTKLF